MAHDDYIVFVDGSSRGNPGPAGVGVVIFKEEDPAKPVAEISQPIGVTTNNVAEYEALIHAFKWLVAEKVDNAVIKMDSELVYRQITGKYRVRSERMAAMISRVRSFMKQLGSVLYVLVPREENRLADRLAQKASQQLKKTQKKFYQEQLIR
jgi:ribonuclease HI